MRRLFEEERRRTKQNKQTRNKERERRERAKEPTNRTDLLPAHQQQREDREEEKGARCNRQKDQGIRKTKKRTIAKNQRLTIHSESESQLIAVYWWMFVLLSESILAKTIRLDGLNENLSLQSLTLSNLAPPAHFLRRLATPWISSRQSRKPTISSSNQSFDECPQFHPRHHFLLDSIGSKLLSSSIHSVRNEKFDF